MKTRTQLQHEFLGHCAEFRDSSLKMKGSTEDKLNMLVFNLLVMIDGFMAAPLCGPYPLYGDEEPHELISGDLHEHWRDYIRPLTNPKS